MYMDISKQKLATCLILFHLLRLRHYRHQQVIMTPPTIQTIDIASHVVDIMQYMQRNELKPVFMVRKLLHNLIQYTILKGAFR